jgi:hypothetical protein
MTTNLGSWSPPTASLSGSNPLSRPTSTSPRVGGRSSRGRPLGWEEMTFELAGAHDVREVIQWAETTLASGEGPASRRGVPVQDREYVVYAKAQSEDRWLHVAGWTPVLPSDSPLNLRRLR